MSHISRKLVNKLQLMSSLNELGSSCDGDGGAKLGPNNSDGGEDRGNDEKGETGKQLLGPFDPRLTLNNWLLQPFFAYLRKISERNSKRNSTYYERKDS